MLLGVAPLPLCNISILHYKQVKLRKDMQHSVPLWNVTFIYFYLFFRSLGLIWLLLSFLTI